MDITSDHYQIHVMLDIETLATTPDAAIISIGAVKFNPNNLDDISDNDKFYCPTTIASNIEMQRAISGSTLEWWASPEQRDAWEEYHKSERQHLLSALDGFAQWFGPDSMPVWGNGATFDNVIMRDAFTKAGIRVPWTYRHDRCHRTMCAQADWLEFKRDGTYHNALDDAMAQARHLQKVTDTLKIILK